MHWLNTEPTPKCNLTPSYTAICHHLVCTNVALLFSIKYRMQEGLFVSSIFGSAFSPSSQQHERWIHSLWDETRLFLQLLSDSLLFVHPFSYQFTTQRSYQQWWQIENIHLRKGHDGWQISVSRPHWLWKKLTFSEQTNYNLFAFTSITTSSRALRANRTIEIDKVFGLLFLVFLNNYIILYLARKIDITLFMISRFLSATSQSFNVQKMSAELNSIVVSWLIE